VFVFRGHLSSVKQPTNLQTIFEALLTIQPERLGGAISVIFGTSNIWFGVNPPP